MPNVRVEVILDSLKCQGYGLCLGADDVFELDLDTNIAHLKQREVDVSRKQEFEQLVRDCPAAAISLRVVEE